MWLGHHFRSQKVKGQGYQAALLTAVLAHQAAAAVGVGTYWPWETAATLQCRLLGGARRFSAHGEERGGTYHCGRPPRACYFFGFWASCGGLSWISASFCALVNQRWAIPVYEILVLYYVFRILFVFGIQYLKCKRESICVLIFQMIQTKYFVFNITSTIRSNKTVTVLRCWSWMNAVLNVECKQVECGVEPQVECGVEVEWTLYCTVSWSARLLLVKC